MKFRTTDPQPASRIALSGDLDVVDADRILEQIVETIDAHPGEHVEIDIGDVEFIDTVTLGALVCALKHARLKGGDIRVVNPPAPILDILRTTGLDEVLL